MPKTLMAMGILVFIIFNCEVLLEHIFEMKWESHLN